MPFDELSVIPLQWEQAEFGLATASPQMRTGEHMFVCMVYINTYVIIFFK